MLVGCLSLPVGLEDPFVRTEKTPSILIFNLRPLFPLRLFFILVVCVCDHTRLVNGRGD